MHKAAAIGALLRVTRGDAHSRKRKRGNGQRLIGCGDQSAFRPASAICSSSWDWTPDTPMAPTHSF
jgi:hypothetical protein